MHYKDKSGHFTTKENNGGECPHKQYQNMSVNELKSITQKEYRQNTKYEQIVYPQAERVYVPTVTEKVKDFGETTKAFFGEEFKGYKGADAIEKLLKEKKGHIKNAFYHKEFGYITLVWGNENCGLKHAIKRRDEDKVNGINDISGLEMARKIPDIIKYGEKVKDKQGRDNIEFDIYRVGIKKQYNDDKITWVVSAMENLEKKEKKKKLSEN